jgi:hypothetical protein
VEYGVLRIRHRRTPVCSPRRFLSLQANHP